MGRGCALRSAPYLVVLESRIELRWYGPGMAGGPLAEAEEASAEYPDFLRAPPDDFWTISWGSTNSICVRRTSTLAARSSPLS